MQNSRFKFYVFQKTDLACANICANKNPTTKFASFSGMCLKIYRFVFFLFLSALFVRCADDLEDAPELRLTRFEQEFFSLDTSRLAEELPNFIEKHRLMAPLFLGELISDRSNPDETPLEAAYFFSDRAAIALLVRHCATGVRPGRLVGAGPTAHVQGVSAVFSGSPCSGSGDDHFCICNRRFYVWR